MDIVGGVKQFARGISRTISQPSKEKPAEEKGWLKENEEDYAKRLMVRRSQRH